MEIISSPSLFSRVHRFSQSLLGRSLIAVMIIGSNPAPMVADGEGEDPGPYASNFSANPDALNCGDLTLSMAVTWSVPVGSDPFAEVNVSTLSGIEIFITGPGGIVGFNHTTNGTNEAELTVDLGLLPQTGSSWDPSDNGTYTVSTVGGIVELVGNPLATNVAQTNAYSIVVNLSYPVIDQVSAGDLAVLSNPAQPYTFTVTYSDPELVDVSTLGIDDVVINTPGGGTLSPTSATPSSGSDASPVTVTYTVNPPGGTWDSNEAGTYTIDVNGSAVFDTKNCAVQASASIASFDVSLLFFDETFNSTTLSATLEQSTGGIAATLDGTDATFAGTLNADSDRSYLRTALGDYANTDFVADVTLTISGTGGTGAAFFGLGLGEPNSSNFFQPSSDSHIFLRAFPDDFITALTDVVDQGVEDFRFGTAGNGTHRLRILNNFEDSQFQFSIDEDYSGTFAPDFVSKIYNIDSNGFTNTDAHIFLGGAGGVAFDNLSVQPFSESTNMVYSAWTGTTDSAYGTSTNWLNAAVPQGGDNLFFPETASTFTVNLGGNRSADSATFAGASNYTVNNNTLTLSSGLIATSGSATHTINSAIEITSDSDWPIDADLNVTGSVSGISANRRIVKSGTGALTLSGGATLSQIEVNAGNLSLFGGVYNLSGDPLIVSAGATGVVQAGADVNGTGASGVRRSIVYQDGSNLTFSGNGTTYDGPRMEIGPFGGGTATVNVQDNANVTLSLYLGVGDALSQGSTGVLNITNGGSVSSPFTRLEENGSIVINGGTLSTGKLTSDGAQTVSVSDAGASSLFIGTGNITSVFDGIIQDGTGGPGSLTKTGNGGLTLGGTNTHTGGTIIADGTLIFSSDSNLGAASSPVIFQGGRLTASTSANVNSLNRSFVTTPTGDAHFRITSSSSINLFPGTVISGPGGLVVEAEEPRHLNIQGDNTYAGSTRVLSGNLDLSGTAPNSRIPDTSTVTISSGARLRFFGGTGIRETIGSLAGTGGVRFFQGQNHLIVGASNANTTFGGSISDSGGSGQLSKIGTGNQTLSGGNNYSNGTTVTNGVLSLAHNNAAGSGTITIKGYQQAVIDDAPLLYWNFDEASGNAIEQISGNSNNDLAPQGGATRTASSLGLGNAAEFNGATGSRFLSTTLAPGATSYSHYAIEFYVQLDDSTSPTYLMEAGTADDPGSDDDVNHPGIIHGYLTPDNLEGFFGAGGRTDTGGPIALTDNQWHHIVVEVNTATDSHTIFVDGTAAGSFAGSNTWNLPRLAIGATLFGTGINPTDGRIDELAFYDLSSGPLTGRDIATHYHATTSSAPTLAYADGINIANPVTLEIGVNLNVDAGESATQSGAITPNSLLSTNPGITKTGNGTLSLTDTNTYAGGTELSGGNLAVTSDVNLGAATGPLVFTGGTLRFDNSFNLASTRPVSLGSGGGTIDTNANSTVIAQAITGTGSLRKTGTGTLSLTAANTFSGGATVSGGSLLANNLTGSATGTGGVNVAGGTLGGTGSISGTLGVGNGGTIAPGNSVGVLSVGTVQFGSGSVLAVELAGSGGVAGVDFDQLASTSSVSLNGTVAVSFVNGFVPGPAQSFEIIDVGNVLSGTFSGMPEGTLIFATGSIGLFITYTAGDGNDVALYTASLTPYEEWAAARGLSVLVDFNPDDDANNDGIPNIVHFALDTDPLGNGINEGKQRYSVESITGLDYFTYTIPVRTGATFSGSPLTSSAIDGIIYTIEADTDLQDPWNLPVVEVAPALDTGLPVLGDFDGVTGSDWTYRSFRLSSPMGTLPKGFMRIEVTEAP